MERKPWPDCRGDGLDDHEPALSAAEANALDESNDELIRALLRRGEHRLAYQADPVFRGQIEVLARLVEDTVDRLLRHTLEHPGTPWLPEAGYVTTPVSIVAEPDV
jgi:hypothetical protein